MLDRGLPESFEVLAEIRCEPRSRSTPVVMFGVDERNVRERALGMGADAYVPKGSLDWSS